jgi:hypothetical protein
MEAVREITEWDCDYQQPNHIYLLSGDSVLAYIPWGEGKPKYLSGKMKIDRRGRKFVKSDLNLFDKVEDSTGIKEVKGSKGETYYVNIEEGYCSCKGFLHRGTCKHLKEVE